MKDYESLAEELAEAKANYHAAANKLPAPELRKLSDHIDAVQAEIVEVLTEGAQPCPGCKQPLHGMAKAPGVFEVGCLGCQVKEELRKPDQDPHVTVFTEPRARGTTAKAAVKAWNEGRRIQKHEIRS